MKKTYVMVGTGSRGTQAFLKPIAEELSDVAEVLAVCDINVLRAKEATVYADLDIPVYSDFDKMLEEQKPDGVIVTTVDATHHDYIIRALEAGCDVISEKPMTTDGEKIRAILEAEKRTGKHVTVTFNCRFHPFFTRIKELLTQNVIGDIYHVHFEWMLDTRHGAEYFRRWHRMRENSGSLLIHKSTHHFDLLNWWLDDEPEMVNAFGTRRFYVPEHQPHGERCLTCQYKKECSFYIDLESHPFNGRMYLQFENEDGYYRDRCPFAEEIDIEDSVALNIRYKKGVVASYSLTAYSPYEGMKVVFTGSEGRMEIYKMYSGAFADDKGVKEIRIYNRYNEEIVYKMPAAPVLPKEMAAADQIQKDNLGGHEGSDPLLRAAIFRGLKKDTYFQKADSRAGAVSIAIGAAANISMEEERSVKISEIVEF